MLFSIVFLAIISPCVTALSDVPSCLDEDGRPVDWFVAYKLPRKRDHGHHKRHHKEEGNFVDDGLGYAFFTSHSAKEGFELSKYPVSDKESIVGRTLAPIYDSTGRKDLLYILYNDEHPDGNTSFTAGHTKGVVVLGQKQGFWLIHSVPKFPPKTDSEYGYPHTGQMYGQSFLCISLGTAVSADALGMQLLYNHPYVYESKVPKNAQSKFPNLAAAARGDHVRKAPYYHAVVFKSFYGRVRFTSFAKYTAFGKDLYADLVAPALKSDLLVETWPNGPGRMNSSCDKKFKVENVRELDFKKIHPEIDFTTKHDHSKWAIALGDKGRPFVCIGDINRMMTQKKRAGGTACFENKTAWKAFNVLIKEVEPCPK